MNEAEKLEANLNTTHENIYYEVISNRLLVILSLLMVYILAPKFGWTGWKIPVFTIILWASGDGAIHYRKKMINFLKSFKKEGSI
jgi:hypothetical protein